MAIGSDELEAKDRSNEKVFAELLSLHSTAGRSSNFEAVAQDTRDGLQGDQLAVAIEWEANDVLRVLVPGDSASGVHQVLTDLREQIYYAAPLPAHQQPLPQIRTDAQGDALEAVVRIPGTQIPSASDPVLYRSSHRLSRTPCTSTVHVHTALSTQQLSVPRGQYSCAAGRSTTRRSVVCSANVRTPVLTLCRPNLFQQPDPISITASPPANQTYRASGWIS